MLEKIKYAAIVFLSLAIAACTPEIAPDKKPAEPDPAYLTVHGENEYKMPNSGGRILLNFEANITVSVTAPDWCEVSIMHHPESSDDGSMKIVVSPNRTKEEREGTILLSGEEVEDVVLTIRQLHRELSNVRSMSDLQLLSSQNNQRLVKDIKFDYDKETRTYSSMYLKWIEGESPEMLVPYFEFTGEKVMVNGTEVKPGVTKVSFADDPVFEVYAENGEKTEYQVKFNCPQINTEIAVLHMKPSRLIDSKNSYVSTEIELFDKSKSSTMDGWWDSKTQGPVEMKARGNSTWGLPKKPFRMKFPVKVSPIGFNHTSERNWVLLAQDMDKSLLRTYIAFEYSKHLFNPGENYHDPEASLFTPHSKYVNVYMTGPYYDSSKHQTIDMDGDYLGVYQMCDRIDRGKGRLEIEPLTRLDGNDPTKITGGYLLEADLHDGQHYTGRKGIKFTYKYPKDDDYDPAQYRYISDYLTEAEYALYDSNFTDPVNGWRRYFDEKTLADFIIIKELVGDMDGFTSIYIYKKRNSPKFFFGPIWDCDKGWRNDVRTPHWEYPPESSLMIYAGFWMPPYVQHDWFWRFMEDPQFRHFLNSRWQQKREELLNLTNKILDEMPVKMAKALEANFTVWPFNFQFSNEAPAPQRDYVTEIAYIRRLTKERAELLDREFAK